MSNIKPTESQRDFAGLLERHCLKLGLDDDLYFDESEAAERLCIRERALLKRIAETVRKLADDEDRDWLASELEKGTIPSASPGSGTVVLADREPRVGDRFSIFSDGPFPGAQGTIVKVGDSGDDGLIADLDDGRRVLLHRSEIHLS